eukprot:symbB.v1.2.016930.t1/scaffold1305.1/size135414/2
MLHADSVGSLSRAPLSQTSVLSGHGSVNSSWSQSSRWAPREEFWVSMGSTKLKEPRRPHTVGRPRSAGASGRPPLPPQRNSKHSKHSRQQSQEDRPGTDYGTDYGPPSARTSPKRRKPQRRSTQCDGDSKEWATPPLIELVPNEVHRKVIELAGPGALVIEMQWSNSVYLPAHNGGEKYKEIASNLIELMEGRLSRGSPLPVLIMDKPVKIKEKTSKIYDRYSEWERSFGMVASNSSFSYAPPSRMGAFEVHLVQGTWDPRLCASGPLGKDQVHRGPPVVGSLGILRNTRSIWSTNIPCFIQSFGPEDGPDCDVCWDGLVPLSFKLRLM